MYDEGYRISESIKRIRLSVNNRINLSSKWQLNINGTIMVDSSRFFLFWKSDSLALFPDSNAANPQLLIRSNLDPSLVYTPSRNTRHALRSRIFFTDNRSDGVGRSSKSWMRYFEYQYQNRNHWLGEANEGVLSAGAVYTGNQVESDSLYGNHQSHNTAIYMQYDQAWKRWRFNAGARAEQFRIGDMDSENYLVFRAGMNYRIATATHLRASFGQGFRPASVAERYVNNNAGTFWVAPNPDLKSERGYTAELGLRQGFAWKSMFKAYADAALFYTRYTDMIEFGFRFNGTLGRLEALARNLSNVIIYGFEISAGGEWEQGPWKIAAQGGYTYIQAKDDNFDNPDPTINTGVNYSSKENFLKYRYRHLWRADVEISRSGWAFGANLRFNSFMVNIDQQFNGVVRGTAEFRSRHDEGDFIADLRFSKKWKQYQFSFFARNAFNRMYLIVPGYLGAPRTLGLAATVRI
jgi:iron complex outermembrane receptor protein